MNNSEMFLRCRKNKTIKPFQCMRMYPPRKYPIYQIAALPSLFTAGFLNKKIEILSKLKLIFNTRNA
jgi:hypothetical protein